MTPSIDLPALLSFARGAKEKAEKATKGPWCVVTRSGNLELHDGNGKAIMGYTAYYPWTPDNPADWTHIAHARTAVPALAAAVEDLVAEVEWTRRQTAAARRTIRRFLRATGEMDLEGAERALEDLRPWLGEATAKMDTAAALSDMARALAPKEDGRG